MSRYFEIADKDNIKNIKWDIPIEHVPSCKDGKAYVVFHAAEDITVPSIWKGFIGAANTGLSTGINTVASKLNSLFGNVETNQYNQKVDYHETFKPTLIHTGLSVRMADDEVLVVHNIDSGSTGLLLSNGTQLILVNSEISIAVYNIFPSDIYVKKGQPIALGLFQKAIINNSIGLDKH